MSPLGHLCREAEKPSGPTSRQEPVGCIQLPHPDRCAGPLARAFRGSVLRGSVLCGLVVGGRDVLVGGRAHSGVKGEGDPLRAERHDAEVLRPVAQGAEHGRGPLLQVLLGALGRGEGAAPVSHDLAVGGDLEHAAGGAAADHGVAVGQALHARDER